MKYFDWDDAKNAKLRAERGIGFEDIVFHIERGDLLDILEHPNPNRYAGQRIFVVRREDYVYLVPFVEDDQTEPPIEVNQVVERKQRLAATEFDMVVPALERYGHQVPVPGKVNDLALAVTPLRRRPAVGRHLTPQFS